MNTLLMHSWFVCCNYDIPTTYHRFYRSTSMLHRWLSTEWSDHLLISMYQAYLWRWYRWWW